MNPAAMNIRVIAKRTSYDVYCTINPPIKEKRDMGNVKVAVKLI
jgi:hypothetical protein